MATARPISKRKRSPKKAAFQTKKPAADPTVMDAGSGGGLFAVHGEASKRLEPANFATYPGGPLPFLQTQPMGESVVTPQRLWYYKLTRYNPIRQLKPEILSHWMDLFQQGYLRYFALLADAIEHRDPTLMTVIPKRKAAVKRLRWEIIKSQDLTPEEDALADQQKEVLFQFYSNVKAGDAVDLNIDMGLPQVIDQMMNAVGHKYAVHEIIWMPGADGSLTAKFNFIPLWFFENRTGKLRFLLMDYGIDGQPMKPGSFMVTTGPGLMEPCAVAYMFKHLCLRDYLIYCEKSAMPGIKGKTQSPYGSDNYNKLVEAVQSIAADFSCVIGLEDEIESMDFSNKGQLPYPGLIDYMDRVMATLWRGADLSTISGKTSQGGQGAMLQGKEEYYLQANDAQHITETLNAQIDPLVIKWHFGEDAKPLVYFKLIMPPNIEATTDIQVINALLSWGITDIGADQILEHFGFPKMMQGDTPLISPQQQQMNAMAAQQDMGKAGAEGYEAADESQFESHMGRLFANAIKAKDARKLLRTGINELAESTAQALKPLRDAVQKVYEVANENLLPAVAKLRSEVPGIVAEINKNPQNAEALNRVMTSGWFNGLIDAKK